LKVDILNKRESQQERCTCPKKQSGDLPVVVQNKKRLSMRLIFFSFIVLLTINSYGSEVYTWEDENGAVHFTDNAANAPPKKIKRQVNGLTSMKRNECANPWGGSSRTSNSPEREQVRLCLPEGFSPVGEENGALAFRDESASCGTLYISISKDSQYHGTDDPKEYAKLKDWLLALMKSSSETKILGSEMVTIDGKRFVAIRAAAKGKVSESSFHIGNGYLLALSAEAPNEAVLSTLGNVIRAAEIP